ncbi:MAG: NADH-quinone oxidoreductase subunit H [Polyangiaceae bacterium]
MRPAVRVLRLVVLALAVLAALAGCQRDVGPQLIDVLDIAPREVERGDRVELLGASFPQGKKAHLTFRGALNRAGEKPATAEIAAEGMASTSTQIELDFTEGLEGLFCGAAERSIHTTFTGDVEVAFPAAMTGAPPVVATLHGVTLDVRPPTPRRALLDERAKEGNNALAFFGIHASKTPPASGGILVDAIDPGSRAEKAGVQAGDLLVEIDRVRIDSLADVIPSGAAPVAKLTLRRGSSPTETKHDLDVAGFRATPPADLYGAALLLLLAAAVILLFMAPTAGALTWVERRIAARMQSRSPAGGLKSFTREEAIPATIDKPLYRLAPYLVFGGVSATFVVMPFGQYLIAADLDVGILYVLAVSSLVTIGLVSGGWAANDRYSLLGGIRSAAQIVSYEVPGAIAVACIVMMTGSLRLQEIIHAQGGWPWEWYLFKNPVTFALFFLYFTTALAGGNRAPFDLPEAEPAAAPTPPATGGRALLFFLAEWANVFVMGGLAAALFLGGWQVPGLSAGAQEAHVGLQALGALVFLLKAWALVFAVLWVRWALPRLRVDQRMMLCWKWLVPLAFAAFALCAGWVAWSPGRTAQLVIGVGMFAIACVGSARFAQRVLFYVRGGHTNADMRLNPFL